MCRPDDHFIRISHVYFEDITKMRELSTGPEVLYTSHFAPCSRSLDHPTVSFTDCFDEHFGEFNSGYIILYETRKELLIDIPEIDLYASKTELGQMASAALLLTIG